jgi:hypothetical protein
MLQNGGIVKQIAGFWLCLGTQLEAKFTDFHFLLGDENPTPIPPALGELARLSDGSGTKSVWNNCQMQQHCSFQQGHLQVSQNLSFWCCFGS